MSIHHEKNIVLMLLVLRLNQEVAKPFELKYVDWKYRSSLIISEINAYNPDIVCLQEIDQSDAVISSAF